ncbi:NAD(P)/FAD-dependent oxidoreductase [Nocardioides nitrophenolicus]|uniref:NAD(P)/FAD-dependent oxidoreductase n=1 Tax=Nocardioides nitrophenolicus TaxID=60489 RepID=UPI00195E09D3|nr:FAD-dependent oxidoreductase [Nocardioides nitrophenolicus]MBM7517046.1 glycine/D-amino acid oxidase-like deaminating enzyme [Nocardioides nitrophenolicus]
MSATVPGTVFSRTPVDRAAVDHALAGVRDACFWIDDLPERAAHPTLRRALDTDLLVVGGGYTGLWTAVLAKQREPDRRVVLLEAAQLGWAASGRNGGFCAASITHGEENGRSRWPDEYDELERLGIANLDAIEATVRAHALDCDYERTGELDVALEPHQVADLRASGAAVIEADELRKLVDSPTYLAGVLDPDVALVHPAKLAHELGRLAAELGVEIFERTRATGVEGGGRHGPVRVTTETGVVTARRVALATNVFPSLLARYRMHTVPVYDYALMTEPLTADQLAAVGWEGRQGVGDLANQFHYYRLSRDNRILWGGYDAVYHYGRRVRPAYERRPETYRRLAEHFLTTFPQLAGLRFSHQWAGAIDTSTRFCAFHGLALNGRVAHTAGFTGLGVAASRFAAEVMLDRLAGLDTERTRLAMVRRLPLPFPPEPIASIGIQTTRWALDRADQRGGHRNAWLRTLDALGLGFDS